MFASVNFSALGSRRSMVCAAALLAVAGLGSIASAAIVDVSVNDFFFDTTTAGNPGTGTPSTTINVGDTVRWTWLGARTHTVTSVMSGMFDSGFQNTGFIFQSTFTDAGTFNYFCQLHGFHDMGTGMTGGMAGSIIVVPTPGAAAGLLAAGALASRRRRVK
ncbi:hypothetical protein BH11PLA1_BH11PLA1_13110 [soil metagenome]